MEVRFYTFSKRNNSTKQPSGNGDSYQCTLKQPTNLISPVIDIDTGNITSAPAWNYAYIPEFSRYYYISDMISMGHHWRFILNVDVMATFKTSIGDAQLYMLRSSADYDGNIYDNYYPVTANHTVTRKSAITPWIHRNDTENINLEDGVYIIGTVAIPYSTGAGSYGSVRYYALQQSQLLTFVTALLNNTITTANGFSTGDASLSLQKALINPLSYIKSCLWFPIMYAAIDGVEMSTIKIWDWNVTATAKLITKNPPYMMSNVTFTIDPHPQATSRGSYLNLAPFTRLSMSCPPFGLIDLDTSALSHDTNVRLQILTDLITGVASVEVRGDTLMLQKFSSQVGVPIQLSEVGYDYSNIPATAVGVAAEAAGSWLGNIMPSGISSAVSQIGTAANAMRTKSSSLGGNGNFSDLRGYAYLYEDFYYIPDEDLYHVGRPLCKLKKANAYANGNYWLAREGDIALAGTAEERDMVKSFLEGGFFYE